jgi:hypothetical protein
MSYSFQVKGADKAAAIKAVSDELGKVVADQPVHAKDQTQAQAAAEAMIGVLADDATKDVHVSMSGSVSWHGDEQISHAYVSVSAGYMTRETSTP